MSRSIVLVAVAALLSGCAGSAKTTTETTASAAPAPSTTSASASATATGPTAAQISWAAQVCTLTVTVKKDANGLATAATSAVASGGNGVGAALSAPLAAVEASAGKLATTIRAVPAGSEDDPDLAAVKVSADQFSASFTNLESSIAGLARSSESSKATAFAAVANAAGTSMSNLSTTSQAIKTAAKNGKGSISQAFSTAPSCATLTK